MVARLAGGRFLGIPLDKNEHAAELQAALGGLKGPLMKVAQILATVPDMLPEEYVAELAKLQTNAPSMGWAFVRRRMAGELGPDWQKCFKSFEHGAAAAASLGQVHRAEAPDGQALACKIQYPDMASTVEADLRQLKLAFSIYRRYDRAIDPSNIHDELSQRLREELDYERERKAMYLYREMLEPKDFVHIPQPVDELSTDRLLTMDWVSGDPLNVWQDASQEVRNGIAKRLFWTWWLPVTRYAVIHGDPHLGNYQVTRGGEGLNLLDFGCIRIFPPNFVGGVVDLYRAIRADDFDAAYAAYEKWGFRNLNKDLVEILNIWAKFIYGPLLEDRVRSVADGVAPGEYGRKQAFEVRKKLKEKGPVTIPREFVFMDRAAIGLGAAYLRLGAELNYHQLFEESLEGFDEAAVAARQSDALSKAGLTV